MNWKTSWNFHDRKMGLARGLTGLWAFFMLAVFPLLMGQGYYRLGEYKYRFFLWACLACLLPALLLCCLAWAERGAAVRSVEKKSGPRPVSPMDLAMLAYLAAAALSWAAGIDRREGWMGVEGWHMGLFTQLLLVLAYFLLSRGPSLDAPFWRRVLFAGHFFGSGAAFAVGIGQRFGFDPFGLYGNMADADRLRFLSTVGQASWYSGYVCLALTVSIALFFLAEDPRLRLAAGIHGMLGFAAAVTQNSDSAFPAIGLLFFGLFWAACDSLDKMERFLETLLLMLSGFKLVGICQSAFPDRAAALGALPTFLSKSLWTWIAFCAVSIAYMLFLDYRRRDPGRNRLRCAKTLRRLAAGLAAAGLCLAVAGAWLVFDARWGNSRGFIWKLTAEEWLRLPAGRKLTGVGPDCFRRYCYADADIAGRIRHFFGWDQVLTNAHNEFLNALFCLGLIGAAAYLGIFLTAVWRFLARERRQTFALAGALAALVYGAHNFFCYQQICCAPFLFLILGLSENLVRTGRKTEADRPAEHT